MPNTSKYWMLIATPQQRHALPQAICDASKEIHWPGSNHFVRLFTTYPDSEVSVFPSIHGAVLTFGSIDVAETKRIILHARSIKDLGTALAQAPGSFSAIVLGPTAAWAQGTTTGTHKTFLTETSNGYMIASRADILARAVGTSVSSDALALRLLTSTPAPHSYGSLFTSVEAVPPGHAVQLTYEPTTRQITPLVSDVSAIETPVYNNLAEAGARLANVLETTIRTRASSSSLRSADLSGGLDSTPVCHLASQVLDGNLIAYTSFDDFPGGEEDLRWANYAAPSMQLREHVIQDRRSLFTFFGGLPTLGDAVDEPSAALVAAPRFKQVYHYMHSLGSSAHFTGFGGDHILVGTPPWDHALFRRSKINGWRTARAHHAAERTKPQETFRQLSDNTTYRDWLLLQLQQKPQTKNATLCDWSPPMWWPRWLTISARNQIADSLISGLKHYSPSGTRSDEFDKHVIQDGGAFVRAMNQIATPADMSVEAPLLDNSVVSFCSRVDRAVRSQPGRFKPLMQQAMQGILDAEIIHRTDKQSGAYQAVIGVQRNHQEVIGLVEDSGLVERGLIDIDAFASAIKPVAGRTPSLETLQTINCAIFLRNS